MLDKAIKNEKLVLQMDIGQIKKLKEKLSQSLKRRKNIATQMTITTLKKISNTYVKIIVETKLMQ